MKLFLLFCLIEVLSLGIVWFDVHGSKNDLEERDSTMTNGRPVREKRNVVVSQKRTSLHGHSVKAH